MPRIPDSNKMRGVLRSPGYWGRSTHYRVLEEETGFKIRVLLQDKLIALGRPVFLYLPVDATTAGSVACTCVKETGQVAEDKCMTCFGTGRAPGYLRFLHQTVFFASAEFASFTLTNTAIDRTLKPNRIGLAAGQLTGTIVTQDKAFTNPNAVDWEVDAVTYLRTAGATAVVEFSTNAGGLWTNISAINGAQRPTGTGNIRFRITLTRTATTDPTPFFEIVRLRRARDEASNQQLLNMRLRDTSLTNGQILMARTWQVEQTIRDISRGRYTDLSGDRAWTSPLDFFDTTLTRDTPPCRIVSREAGPHAFYEHRFGVDTGRRFALVSESYNEHIIIFTHQSFADRLIPPGENLSLVW
jgi:hypothetical protein